MTNNYWRDREQEHIRKQIQNDARIAEQLRQNQMRAYQEIETQILAFYTRYADTEGINISEARKRVTKLDIDQYKDKAKRYVAERNFTKRANEEMRLYNVTMQINRLELLKQHIRLEIIAATSAEELILYEELTKSARAEYERQSSILGATIQANQKTIESIVMASFLNATWSDRLWNNQDALRMELEKLLNDGMVQGLNPRVLARRLREKFNSSVYNSERLMRTEQARVQGDVFKDSMEQGGYDQYEYIAEPTACKICGDLDGEIFNVSEMQVGTNMYPMHPNCRCSTAAYFDREAFEADLAERGL